MERFTNVSENARRTLLETRAIERDSTVLSESVQPLWISGRLRRETPNSRKSEDERSKASTNPAHCYRTFGSGPRWRPYPTQLLLPEPQPVNMGRHGVVPLPTVSLPGHRKWRDRPECPGHGGITATGRAAAQLPCGLVGLQHVQGHSQGIRLAVSRLSTGDATSGVVLKTAGHGPHCALRRTSSPWGKQDGRLM
jgi:hypothetical protein